MEYFPAPLEKLVEQFARLPGIGGKSAQRLAFYLRFCQHMAGISGKNSFYLRQSHGLFRFSMLLYGGSGHWRAGHCRKAF